MVHWARTWSDSGHPRLYVSLPLPWRDSVRSHREQSWLWLYLPRRSAIVCFELCAYIFRRHAEAYRLPRRSAGCGHTRSRTVPNARGCTDHRVRLNMFTKSASSNWHLDWVLILLFFFHRLIPNRSPDNSASGRAAEKNNGDSHSNWRSGWCLVPPSRNGIRRCTKWPGCP